MAQRGEMTLNSERSDVDGVVERYWRCLVRAGRSEQSSRARIDIRNINESLAVVLFLLCMNGICSLSKLIFIEKLKI